MSLTFPSFSMTAVLMLSTLCLWPTRLEARQATEIEGTWFVNVTLRNCQTQAPLGPPFNSIVSFVADGTIVESTEASAFAVGQRPAAQGRWTRIGTRTYRQRMLALVAFDTPPAPPTSPGFLRGGSIVTHTVEMTGADTFTSSGTNAFYDANGQQYRSGCSTAVGGRFR